MTKAVEAVSGVIVRKHKGVLNPAFHNPAPLPPELNGLLDVRAWVNSLTTGDRYDEPNPDYMAQRMAMLTLSAGSFEEALVDEPMDGLQKLIPDAPWQSSGNIMITGLYVARSQQETGNPTYMLLDYWNKATGDEITTTTGATKLQLLFALALATGIWPIEGQIKRTDRKDRGGRYLFSFYPEED
jgi:hypothetical protein